MAIPKIQKTTEHLERLARQPAIDDSADDKHFEMVMLALLLSVGTIVLLVVESVIGSKKDAEHDQRLQRLERIERIDSIGRRF